MCAVAETLTVLKGEVLTKSKTSTFGFEIPIENFLKRLLPYPEENAEPKVLERKIIRASANKSIVTWLFEVILLHLDVVVRATVQNDSAHSRKYVSMKVWMEDEEGKGLRPLDKDRELHFDTPDIMSNGVVVADSVMVVMKMKSYLEEDRPLSIKVVFCQF